MTISFRNEKEIKTFSEERKLRICHHRHQTYPKGIITVSSLNKKKRTKAGILEHQERTQSEQEYGQTDSSPLKYPKFCLTIEANVVPLADVILSACGGNV